MCALEVIQATMIQEVSGPVSEGNGGTSKGDPTAGTGGDNDGSQPMSIITTADRAGVGIVTAVFLIGTLGGSYWLVAEELDFVVRFRWRKQRFGYCLNTHIQGFRPFLLVHN